MSHDEYSPAPLPRAVVRVSVWLVIVAWLGTSARSKCGPCAKVGLDHPARADGYCMACWVRREAALFRPLKIPDAATGEGEGEEWKMREMYGLVDMRRLPPIDFSGS